jgi:hypothetical protein
VRPFKGIFCDDISEFESYHPSHAVGSRLIEVQPRTDIAADFGSATTQTIQTGAGEVHSTTEQISLTVNSIADGLSTDTVELTKFQGVTSLLPSDFHVV